MSVDVGKFGWGWLFGVDVRAVCCAERVRGPVADSGGRSEPFASSLAVSRGSFEM